jgi:hypothetical protein
MPYYAYKHTDGKAKACTLPDSATLLRAAYVVPGSVVELQRLPNVDEMLDGNLQIVFRSKRKARQLAVLAQEIAALTVADRNKLLTAIAAEFLQGHPQFAKSLGLNVEGDEPA